MLKHNAESRDATRMRNGFTLVELLVVIVILGILAAVVVFAVSGIRDQGEESACKADYRTLESAIEAYNAKDDLATDWPATETDLVNAELLKSVSSKYDFAGTPNGTARPTLTHQDADCNGITSTTP